MEWIVIVLIAVVAPAAAFGLLNFLDSQVDLAAPLGFGDKKASQAYIITGTFLWFVLVALIVAYYANAKAASAEINARDLADEVADYSNSGPGIIAARELTDADPLSLATAYYEALGYQHVDQFAGIEGDAVKLFELGKPKSDRSTWRHKGAIVYQNGQSASFFINILHSDGSWKFGSEEHIKRLHYMRPVKIVTAIDREIIKFMVDKSDYLLSIGLASYSDGNASKQGNTKLAIARGYNLAYAALELDWKEPDRLRAYWLGGATNPPDDEKLEPLQRSAILVGVSAPQDVIVEDVLTATMQVIDVPGVDLNGYRYSPSNPKPVKRKIEPGVGYFKVEEVELKPSIDGESGVEVLPAVDETIDR